jgi:inorganic pyrophosphatase
VTDLSHLPAFNDDGNLNVVIESPRGSGLKFKYDTGRSIMTLSRPLPVGLSYPHDWGFVPSTCAADGDPLDAVVMWDGTSYPGVVVVCRPVGLLRVEQTNLQSRARERNDRVMTLPAKAARWDGIRTIFDMSERVRLEQQQFFQAAVEFEGKDISILGWAGPEEALAVARSAEHHEPTSEFR